MSLVVVGLEPERSPLDLLEQVAVPDEQLAKALAALRDRRNLTETVVLSTCLRTEVYAVAERFHDGVADIQGFLADRAGIPLEALAPHLAIRFDEQVPEHLFEVAAGMRSAVLGETEVLGQVRRAGERAAAERAAGPVLAELFRRAVQAGRRVRAGTAIAQGTLSLSHVAAELVTERLGGVAGRRVVVVGAGEMGTGVARALGRSGADVVVANRTAAKGRAVAELAGGRAVGLDALAGELVLADAAVGCIGGTAPPLDLGLFEEVVARRSGPAQPPPTDPLVVVDLGMPRTVHPAVGRLPGVELADLDAIRQLADEAMAGRQAELDSADAIVQAEVERYRAELRARGAAPAVAALRERVEQLRDAAVDRQRARHAGLTDEQWSAVEAVTRDVVARLLHPPSVALKETAGTPRGERLLEAVRALFDL